MTKEDIQAELDRWPFVPFRIHFVSGKTLDVSDGAEAWMLRRSTLVTRLREKREPSYDIVALANIERIERLDRRPEGKRT